jgi:hypothetical protein
MTNEEIALELTKLVHQQIMTAEQGDERKASATAYAGILGFVYTRILGIIRDDPTSKTTTEAATPSRSSTPQRSA